MGDGISVHRRIRKGALVVSEKRDPVQDEPRWASSRGNSGEPSAASRVCDERFGKNRRTALDSAPGSQNHRCLL